MSDEWGKRLNESKEDDKKLEAVGEDPACQCAGAAASSALGDLFQAVDLCLSLWGAADVQPLLHMGKGQLLVSTHTAMINVRGMIADKRRRVQTTLSVRARGL
jgi:hypothetical protein